MRIAISGTIGSGKSSIKNYLINKGFNVYDLDVINRELLKKNHKGYNELIKYFKDILDENHEINREALANVVFKDKNSLNKLNNIMHPLIKDELLKLFNNHDLVICEVPLLFETDFYKLFDYYLIVIADEEIALNRLVNRGLKIEDAKNRMANQMSQALKIQKASYVIDNSYDLDNLYSKVDEWLKEMNLC